jgi:hypothetical protein
VGAAHWEERPSFEVGPLRGRLRLEGTWTEVIVRRLHRPALVSLTGRRIADYLAAELRGQLLGRDVTVTVHDRMARGRAQKLRRVEPVRFTGERLPLPMVVSVAGHESIRVELHLVPEGGEPGRVGVACGGTVVYDDLADALDGRFAHEPWTAGRVAGLLDFPGFAVAPGSRRGVLLDDAADAFARVVESELAAAVRERLGEDERRRAAAIEADLVQKLARAFRDLPREAPEYDFLAVRGRGRPPRAAGTAADGEAVGTATPEAAADDLQTVADDTVVTLFPPGPLARVAIVPARSRVEPNGERRLRARAEDADGMPIWEVAYVWNVAEGPGAIETCRNAEAVFRAAARFGMARVSVTAHKDGREASGEAIIEVVDEVSADGRQAGIPEPAFVADPRGEWRSRVNDGCWEVNNAHRDFLSVEAAPRRKLRYLTALLAKEIVLHSYPMPQGGLLLERLVSVLAMTERQLERG